jgi:hypothetical protein
MRHFCNFFLFLKTKKYPISLLSWRLEVLDVNCPVSGARLCDEGGAVLQPVQGDGGLLRGQDETLRGSQDRPVHHRWGGIIRKKLKKYFFSHEKKCQKQDIFTKKVLLNLNEFYTSGFRSGSETLRFSH